MSRQKLFLSHLSAVPLFANLSRGDLGLLAKRAEEVHVRPGKTLITEGAPGHEFFAILDGTAKVERRGRKVATLEIGDTFGELALLERAPRNASVIAVTDMDLVVIGQREFAGLIDDVPGFGRKLLAAMAHRLREYDAKAVQ
jgi:CRP-like cAMP-binding protein